MLVNLKGKIFKVLKSEELVFCKLLWRDRQNKEDPWRINSALNHGGENSQEGMTVVLKNRSDTGRIMKLGTKEENINLPCVVVRRSKKILTEILGIRNKSFSNWFFIMLVTTCSMVHIVKSAHRVKAWPNHQRLRSISLFINTRTSFIFIGIASKRMTEKSRRGRKSWFISMLKSSCMLYDLFMSGLFSVDCWMFIGKSKDFVSSQDELSNNPNYYKLRPKLRETFNRNFHKRCLGFSLPKAKKNSMVTWYTSRFSKLQLFTQLDVDIICLECV